MDNLKDQTQLTYEELETLRAIEMEKEALDRKMVELEKDRDFLVKAAEYFDNQRNDASGKA